MSTAARPFFFAALVGTFVIGTSLAVAQPGDRDNFDQPREGDRVGDRSDQDRDRDRDIDARRDNQERVNENDRRNERDRDQRPRELRDTSRFGNSDRDQPAGLGVVVIEQNGGVVVREVSEGSPAAQAGIRPGDEILSIDNRRVNAPTQLSQLVRQHEPNTQVEVRFIRDNQTHVVTARLQSRQDALNIDRDSRVRMEESQFHGSPPWGSDDLRMHIDALERQVQQMQREIRQLRSMLDDDPAGRDFTYSSSRESRLTQPERRSESTRFGDRPANDRENRNLESSER